MATANVATYDNVAVSTTNATFYVEFVDKAAGNVATYTNTSLTYNPSTGNLAATNFVGSGQYLTNIPTTGVSGTVNTANVSMYANVTASTTNATFYPTLVNATSGNLADVTASSFTYNPSTGALNATSFNGAGTGLTGTASSLSVNFATSATNATNAVNATNATNATYAVQASSVSINSSTSSTTYYPIFVDTAGTGIQYEYVDGNGYLKYTPSTGNLTTANLMATFGANINTGKNSGTGADFYVSGKNDNTLLWAHAGTYDSVVIGNSATTSSTVNGAKLVINTNDSIMLPKGTNAQRPSASGLGTDTAGMFRYSTTVGAVEWYNGSSWQTASTQYTVIQANTQNGDGSTTAFTLPIAGTTASTIVSINGIVQIPTTAYSISGTTLTFTEAPSAGDVIDIRELTTTTTVTSLSSATGYTQITVDDASGVMLYAGTSSQTAAFQVPTTGGLVTRDANVAVASANTLTTLDTFNKTVYRSAKYIVQVTNGNNFQTEEVLVVQDGTIAMASPYGIVSTNGNLGIISATISGSNVLLQFTAANASNQVRLYREYIPL